MFRTVIIIGNRTKGSAGGNWPRVGNPTFPERGRRLLTDYCQPQRCPEKGSRVRTQNRSRLRGRSNGQVTGRSDSEDVRTHTLQADFEPQAFETGSTIDGCSIGGYPVGGNGPALPRVYEFPFDSRRSTPTAASHSRTLATSSGESTRQEANEGSGPPTRTPIPSGSTVSNADSSVRSSPT